MHVESRQDFCIRSMRREPDFPPVIGENGIERQFALREGITQFIHPGRRDKIEKSRCGKKVYAIK